MKANQHLLLWERIQAFSVDDPSAPRKFSDKLACENAWTPAFTSRAVEEYKRFIFLCCISPTGGSPSPVVDEVWHLHLTYTENYWKRFCAETLEKEIHHHPSKGGTAEKERHQRWYADTLALYRDVFDEEPPADIWPPPSPQPFFEPPPPPDYLQAYGKNLHFFLLPLLCPLLFGKFHPYALNGPQFLVFYALLLAATAFVFFRVRSEKSKLLDERIAAAGIADANAFQLARYVYGSNKAVETAVVDLVSKGVLVPEDNGDLVFYPERCKAEEVRNNPLAASLAVAYKEAYVLNLKDVEACYQSDGTHHAGLQQLYQSVVRNDHARFVVVALVALIGFIRIRQGMANHRPVDYLTALLLVGGFALFFFALSLSAKELLKRRFVDRYNQNQLAAPPQQNPAAQFLFLGLTALAGTYVFANLEHTFRRHGGSGTASADTSGGCGSSGCGSGCGGGCGGCGGGD